MPHESFFAGHPMAHEVFERLRTVLGEIGPFEVRTSKSQVAFRRRRGFAFVWIPGQYLRNPAAEVVLSIALARRDPSPRFKEGAGPHWEVYYTDPNAEPDPTRWRTDLVVPYRVAWAVSSRVGRLARVEFRNGQ